MAKSRQHTAAVCSLLMKDLDQEELFRVLKAVLSERFDVLQSLVEWAVPDLVYAPSKAITKLKYTGVVKSFDEEKRQGYIECKDIHDAYGYDVILSGDRLRRVIVGDVVSFAILLDDNNKPEAFDVQNHSVPERAHGYNNKESGGRINNAHEQKHKRKWSEEKGDEQAAKDGKWQERQRLRKAAPTAKKDKMAGQNTEHGGKARGKGMSLWSGAIRKLMGKMTTEKWDAAKGASKLSDGGSANWSGTQASKQTSDGSQQWDGTIPAWRRKTGKGPGSRACGTGSWGSGAGKITPASKPMSRSSAQTG